MRYSDSNYKPFYAQDLHRELHFRGAKLDRIYRILLALNNNGRSWYKLAKEAGVAYGWAHRKLDELKIKGLIMGSQVIKPRELFRIWADHRVPIYVREYHVKDPQGILKGSPLEFAITKYYAENLLNNYLFPKVYDLYVKAQDIDTWHELLSSKGYVGSGNLRILVVDEHVFWKTKRVDGWPLVSLQQLIVDLIREGAECIEAVDQLLEKHYHDQWIV